MIILKYCSLISRRIISIEDEFIIIGNDFDVYSQTKLMYLDKTLIVDCGFTTGKPWIKINKNYKEISDINVL